jgi:four helix bundle protein
MVRSFRDLDAWRLGLELVEVTYRCTAAFPKSETFGLAAQMRRAAVSIPSNIAEGQARKSSKEFLQFISIALGSLAELDTQLELTVRLNYQSEEIHVAIAKASVLGKKLYRLQRAIKNNLSEPPVVTDHRSPTTNHVRS